MLTSLKAHIACAGLAAHPDLSGGDPRAVVRWIADQARRHSTEGARIRGIRLDATARGFRPRELSRSARRDVAAGLSRSELAFGGLDTLIPPEHFSQADTQDRAVLAVTQACELCADLASLASGEATLCVELPTACPEAVVAAIDAAGERWGVRVCDLGVPGKDARRSGLWVGVDPAAVLVAGGNPLRAITDAGDRLGAARLSDVNSMGRCPVGAEGSKLDSAGYLALLGLGGLDAVTIDLRRLDDPSAGVRAAASTLERVHMPPV